MIKKIFYIFNKKQKFHLFILLIIITIGAFLELLGVSGILPLVNVVLTPNTINEKWYFIAMQDILKIHEVGQFVLVLALGLSILYIIKNIFLIMMYDLQYRFTNNNQRHLAIKLMNTYVNQEYLFHVSHNVADLQRNISVDVAQFFLVILNFLQLITEGMVCLVLGVFLLITDITTTITVVLLLGVFLTVFAAIFKKKLGVLGQRNREVNATATKWLLQTFGGIKEIKVFNKERFFLRNYDQSYADYAVIQRKQSLMGIIPKPIMETICICGLLLTVAVKIYFGSEEEINNFFPTISVFAIAAFRMLPSFNRITAYMSAIMYNRSSVAAVYKDLKQLETVPEGSDENFKTSGEFHVNTEIKIERVSFVYPNMENEVLSDISLVIQKNKSTAIIGPSGAGKSTLADIILGVLRPVSGSVKVDGVDINENMNAWHKAVGYIPQTIYLMDDTIKSNIAFGIDDQEIDQERLWEVIKEAQLSEFIQSLENGLETKIGDRGVRLSGGQRQRIGIARALYHNPQVLLLDEATSALDGDTEEAVMDAINQLHGNKTLIIIAHRLTTIQKCDIIYEVSDGKIIQKPKEVLFGSK